MPDAAPSFFCAENSDGVKTPLQAVEAAAAAAPFLFLEAEIGFEKLEAVGEFTGERLLARKPEVYRAIVRMLAEGLSGSSIARACQVSRNTVAAVREREGISIEQQKKELLATIRRGSQVAAERVVELIPHIQSAKDAAITLAVLVDKAQLLAGEATSRVERVDATEDKLRDMLAALPVLEAEVLTGPSSGAPGQKGPGALGLPGGVGLPVDVESSVSSVFQEGSVPLSATLSATSGQSAAAEPVETTPRAEDLRGGEGVEILAAPPHHTTHQGSQKILSKGDSSAPSPAAP
jgi:hypothetical protein